MTDIKTAERVLAQLTDKLDRATARVDALVGERQRVGFLVYADDDAAAGVRLKELNSEMATLATDIEGIRAALVEAKRRLAAAKAATAQVDSAERRVRVQAILDELVKVAFSLDETMPHPDGSGRVYRLDNPPARNEVGALMSSLCLELRALGHPDVKFPPGSWDRGAWQDLRRAILNTMQAAWPGPTQRLTKERDSFAGLLGALAKIIRANLQSETADAA
jgi:hypothetical protein